MSSIIDDCTKYIVESLKGKKKQEGKNQSEEDLKQQKLYV